MQTGLFLTHLAALAGKACVLHQKRHSLGMQFSIFMMVVSTFLELSCDCRQKDRLHSSLTLKPTTGRFYLWLGFLLGRNPSPLHEDEVFENTCNMKVSEAASEGNKPGIVIIINKP